MDEARPVVGADNRTLALRAVAAYLYDAIERGEVLELAEEATTSGCVGLRLPEQVLISREFKMPKALVLGRPIKGKPQIIAIYRYNATADKLQRIG
jgi:hypothetical protein